MSYFVVAIDGPAASGKSSVASAVAHELNIPCINTGNMYRAVTYILLKNKINLDDDEALFSCLKTIQLSYRKELSGEYDLYCNGQKCSDEIRSIEVVEKVSFVASKLAVRELLVELQRSIAQHMSLVMEGRDIGTVVFPHAKHKFFLTATPLERARRRLAQSGEVSEASTLESVASAISARDQQDMKREIAPLRQANDAILIDSTHLDKTATVALVLSYINLQRSTCI